MSEFSDEEAYKIELPAKATKIITDINGLSIMPSSALGRI